MYLFHAQSTLSRRSSVQQPVVGVWSCENKVRKRVEVKSKILQSSRKKALKTSLNDTHRCPSIEWEWVAYVESLLLRVHNQQSLLGFMAVPSSEKDVF